MKRDLPIMINLSSIKKSNTKQIHKAAFLEITISTSDEYVRMELNVVYFQ